MMLSSAQCTHLTQSQSARAGYTCRMHSYDLPRRSGCFASAGAPPPRHAQQDRAAAFGCCHSDLSRRSLAASNLRQHRCVRLSAESNHATGARGGLSGGGAAGAEETDVVIVGAGLAGLAAALALQKAGVPFVILEAGDGVGGRVRTDEVDGFLLDCGFQIFLTSYPECQELLDYDALNLNPFYAGADVRFNGAWHRVADPLRHFGDSLGSLTNPIGSPLDKINVGVFRLKALLGGTYDSFQEEETTTLKRLQAEGFSAAIIDRFFRPFLGGIFFDTGLGTTSRLFRFVMRMLATGSNCLPAAGIGAVTQQLASRLPADAIRLGSPVASVAGVDHGAAKTAEGAAKAGEGGVVKTEGGHTVHAHKGVIVAAEGPAAALLLGPRLPGGAAKQATSGVGTCCLYFAADRAPTDEAMLYLNGDGSGIVNNACFPSNVAPSYAPPGQPDLSDEQLVAKVKTELGGWFGSSQVGGWRHLRTYRIPFAQPNQAPPAPPTDLQRSVDLGSGIFVCGDHRETATFDGALRSGRRAAEALLDRAKRS